MNIFRNKINAFFPQMVQWRRYLHQHPELSFQEEKTAQFVAAQLKQWGIDVQEHVGGYGVVGMLYGNKEGPTVALRADMDALPIQDEKSCEYSSKVDGIMHACGHDAHTTTLLSIAKLLSEEKDALRGNVKFIFQHAEELAPGGAISMINEGVLDDVDVIYGVHLWSPSAVGTAETREGAFMAAADRFVVKIKGKGGHGGLPQNTIDSVVIGSHLVVNLQSIVSRNVDPTQAAVISVGSIHAGTTFNIIAESCTLEGTVRTFDENIRKQVQNRIETIVENTCAMYQADYSIDYQLGYPPVVNHAQEVKRFEKVAGSVFGDDGVKTSPKVMAAEDFAYYLQRVPGCFIFVGAGNEEVDAIYPHHHPRFDIDENAMKNAAELLIKLTLDYMHD